MITQDGFRIKPSHAIVHVNIFGPISNPVDNIQRELPDANNEHSLTCVHMQHNMDQFTTQ